MTKLDESWVQAGQSPTWNFETDPECKGIYVQKKEQVGTNGSNMYIIQDVSGDRFGVWGSTVLDTRMSEIPLHAEVLIKYVGKVPSQSRKGATMKMFEVYYKEPTINLDE